MRVKYYLNDPFGHKLQITLINVTTFYALKNNFTRKTDGFMLKTFDFTRKTSFGFTRKTLDFTCKTLDFTRRTVIYDTNGLPYTLGIDDISILRAELICWTHVDVVQRGVDARWLYMVSHRAYNCISNSLTILNSALTS